MVFNHLYRYGRFVATMKLANRFQASNQLAKADTVLLGCLEACWKNLAFFAVIVNLSIDTYSSLTILAAYLLGKGGNTAQ